MTDARTGYGPPQDVEASELWLALTALPMPHEVVDFPVKEPVFGESIGKVAIVPLAPEELMQCQKVAYEFTSKLTGEKPKAGEESPAFRDIMGTEANVQILWRALRDVSDKTLKRPAFKAPTMLRRAPFTNDILYVLLQSYLRTCVTKGPIVAVMSKDEMNAWLDRLEEGGAANPLDLLSRGMLSDLLMHSASRCKALRTASSSPGSPLDALDDEAMKMSDAAQPQSPPADQVDDLTADTVEIPKE